MSEPLTATRRTGLGRERPVPEKAVRVWLAALNFYPTYAGPAIRFRRYLPGFRRHGIEMRVFAGTPEMVKASASDVARDWGAWEPGARLPSVEVDGITVERVRLPDENKRVRKRIFGPALVRRLAEAGEPPQVVQLLDYDLRMVGTLLRLRRLGVRTVHTATMLPDLRDRHPIKRELLRRYIAWPMRLVDAVAVSSGVMRESLRDMGVRGRIEVIPNGVDTERFRPPRTPDEATDARRELGIPADHTMLLFLGPIVSRKGIDLLLDAFGRLAGGRSDLHLVLAGPRLDRTHPGNTGFHRRIMELVETSGAAARIHFPGMVRDPERYLRAADAFVFTSRREGMPNVVPEAMATGLPVVSTPFIGLPEEFGEPGRHFELADFDPDALAARIEHLLSDDERRRSMGTAAREWVMRTMDVEASVRAYARLYAELAEPPKREESG